MTDIIHELNILKKKDFQYVLADLYKQEEELLIKIYLLNFIHVFDKLNKTLKIRQLNISILASLEYDNDIGDFFNFKIKNNKDNFIYNKFKLASPKNKSKTELLIKEIHSSINELNHNFNKMYFNDEIEEKKIYQFNFSTEGIQEFKDFLLSKKLKTILEYSTLNQNINNQNQNNPITKI